MKKFKIILIFIILLGSYSMAAQELLTVNDAIAQALQSNYDLRIAKNDTEIATIESSTLNSGYLPRVSASGNVGYRDENQNVTFADGNSTSIEGAITETYGAGITAEYTIFDGLERKFNFKKKEANTNLKKYQERQAIENTIVSIYDSYYTVAYQTQIASNLKLNIENSFDRLNRAEKKLKYGQGSKLDELNAKVDLNTDSISYASAVKDLKNAKRNLNLLIGRGIKTAYRIDTTVVFMERLDEQAVLQSALENNISALLNKQNILLSELDIKINKAKFLPKINGSASYNWNESQNPPTSFALASEVYGLNLGLNLSWNIFDGGTNSTRVKTSRITKENREIELKRASEELKKEIYNAYEDYLNRQFTLKAEKNNVTTNELNFSRTQKQFSLGQVTAVEFRQAQINLFNALNNLAKAKYDLKIAEIKLLQLSGQLIE